jgi:hypothetical protein
MKIFHRLIAGVWLTTSILARRVALPLLFLGAGLMFAHPCAAAPFEWQSTGSLNVAAGDRTATLLTDGKVLVVGGIDGNYNSITTSEVFDPATGSTARSGNLAQGRNWHTATLLVTEECS